MATAWQRHGIDMPAVPLLVIPRRLRGPAVASLSASCAHRRADSGASLNLPGTSRGAGRTCARGQEGGLSWAMSSAAASEAQEPLASPTSEIARSLVPVLSATLHALRVALLAPALLGMGSRKRGTDIARGCLREKLQLLADMTRRAVEDRPGV